MKSSVERSFSTARKYRFTCSNSSAESVSDQSSPNCFGSQMTDGVSGGAMGVIASPLQSTRTNGGSNSQRLEFQPRPHSSSSGVWHDAHTLSVRWKRCMALNGTQYFVPHQLARADTVWPRFP